jgi:oligopeptide/dipeptide ABC transporter ATP-binding protein
MRLVLEVRGLRTEFPTRTGVVRATNDVNFSVDEGEVLGVVGESGCGKSVLLRTVLAILPSPGRVTAGEVLFDGQDLLRLPEQKLRQLRGGDVALIPQDPINNLNPSLTVGYQMERALKLHRSEKPSHGWSHEAEQMLNQVGIDARGKLGRYPFNFSQGQLQRVMTAIAVLSGHPRLLLADEPTTALDVTIQAQILWLISRFQRERKMSVVFVTHDLGVIAQVADRVMVMYAGSVVEEAPVRDLFKQPRHPYTIALLRSASGFLDSSGKRQYTLEGSPPDLVHLPPGCPFAPRCASATEICVSSAPELRKIDAGQVACHHAERILETKP